MAKHKPGRLVRVNDKLLLEAVLFHDGVGVNLSMPLSDGPIPSQAELDKLYQMEADDEWRCGLSFDISMSDVPDMVVAFRHLQENLLDLLGNCEYEEGELQEMEDKHLKCYRCTTKDCGDCDDV